MYKSLKEYLRSHGFHNTKLWQFCKILKSDIRCFLFFKNLSKKKELKDAILVINHMFDGEIESLKRCINKSNIKNNYSLIEIKPEPFFSRAITWFPICIRDGHISYEDESINFIKKKYKKYCEKILNKFVNRVNIKYLIMPSDSFYWLREFIVACREVGIKVIVVDKEGMITPYSFENEPKRIRKLFPPIADYFFVWSRRQKDFWMNCGVAEASIKIIGSLRTDLFYEMPRTVSGTILAFDFDFDAYINVVNLKSIPVGVEKNWHGLRNDFHECLFSIASENINIKLKIKCHPQQIIVDFPTKLKNLPNVEIIYGAPKKMNELFSDCMMIIGFQTTALLEASLAGLPAIYIGWGRLHEQIKEILLPWSECGYGIEYASSKEMLIEIVRKRIYSLDFNNNEPKYRMEEYFYLPNGKVAERFFEKLNHLDGWE